MEVNAMDLMGGRITAAQLLNDPKSRAVLEKRFGKWLKHPLVRSAGSLTLTQVIELTKTYIPKKDIDATLEELKKL